MAKETVTNQTERNIPTEEEFLKDVGNQTERNIPTEEEFLKDVGGLEGYDAWRARKLKNKAKHV